MRKLLMCLIVLHTWPLQSGIVHSYVSQSKQQALFVGLQKLGFYAKQPFSEGDFFDTTKLSNTEVATRMLQQEGVELQNSVHTEDGASLETYARTLEKPNYTFILPAGFYPGKLFGMAPFCKFLPPNSNLFLFHARDRGNSTSPTLPNDLWRYGRDHWKDIKAMIQHANVEAPHSSIYIVGICAGAFHTLWAAYMIGNELHNNNVKGIVADSTMTSNWEMAKTAIPRELTKKQPAYIAAVCRFGLHAIRYGIYKPLTWILGLEHDTQITPAVTRNIPVPICYMHGKQDPYSHIENIRNLQRNNYNTLIKFDSQPEESIHALLHFKHTDQYRTHLNYFIENPTTSIVKEIARETS